jgi:hypothetical protein
MRIAAVAVLFVLAVPASASADSYTAVYNAYSQSGTLPACQFSTAELESALTEAPTYDVEYFGEFSDAIQAAISERASGDCTRHHAGSALPRPRGPLPPAPRLPTSLTPGTGAGIPLPLLLALILAGLAVLGGGAAALARGFGWDPQWAQSVRHSWGEAEYRVAGTWEEFRDWLRAGGSG